MSFRIAAMASGVLRVDKGRVGQKMDMVASMRGVDDAQRAILGDAQAIAG